MSEPHGQNAFEFYTGRFRAAFLSRNYEEALVFAAKGYCLSVEMQDRFYGEVFVQLLNEVLRTISPSSSTANSDNATCSFCGDDGRQTRITNGARGAICELCAERIHQAFMARK
jgi:hypothetical protein